MGAPPGDLDERCAGYAETFAEARENLSRLRTIRTLAGAGPRWWERCTNDWSAVARLPPNTALRVPASLLVVDLHKLLAVFAPHVLPPETLTLWFRSWSQPDGRVHLQMLPDEGVLLAIDPGKLLNGIIDGTIQLDWKSQVAWRDEIVRLAETEGLFPGLSKT